MAETLLDPLPIAILMGVVGAITFTLIGIVSGTDETATLAPLTLVVILLGVEPIGVFTFFLAGCISKHMTHAIPTMLLGIPGDTMAVPILEDAAQMRALGIPHIALRKAISAAAISATIAVPASVLFALLLSPFGEAVQSIAPWLFLAAALGISYYSPARWAGIVALVPFVALVLGLKAWTDTLKVELSISYFLGIAIGPMVADLVLALSPQQRKNMRRQSPSRVFLAPDTDKSRSYFPNPFKVLDRRQQGAVAATSIVSSATFVFSPVAMTVLMGELVGARIKNAYQRLTTVISAKNGTTESTYIAEALIPLIAFGLPLSPVAAGPAAPLFNAPPVFVTDPDAGRIDNLSTAMTTPQFLVFGLMSVALALIIAYPFAMRYAYPAAKWVITKVSHEAIIAAFTGLIVVVSVWEGGLPALVVVLTVGLVGGLLVKMVKVHAGVLFMGYYVAVLTVPAVLGVAS